MIYSSNQLDDYGFKQHPIIVSRRLDISSRIHPHKIRLYCLLTGVGDNHPIQSAYSRSLSFIGSLLPLPWYRRTDTKSVVGKPQLVDD